MSNFNDKIAEFVGDGIPAYNRKLNEIIKRLNWLMGMRSVNGKPITESDQGPVFDLAPASSSGPNPWATDPAGNAAGWTLLVILDTDWATTGDFTSRWIWCGPPIDYNPVPWLDDPSGNPAGWIVCAQNAFWGTGQCASGTTCSNYQNAIVNSSSADDFTSPVWVSYGPSAPPIVPPSSCTPRFYLIAPDYAQAMPGSPSQPCVYFSPALITGDPSSPLTYDYAITYDGTQIFHISGSTPVTNPGSVGGIVPIDPAGWLWDPGDIPGYAQGSKNWVYPYNGPASANTNPQLVHTFTYSFLRLCSCVFLTQNFMTG